MAAASNQHHRKRRKSRAVISAIALSTVALAIAACGSSHQLAEPQTTAVAAENDGASTQTVSPPMTEVRPRRVVYCEDLEADPLRGLDEQEPDCIPAPPRTSTTQEECRDCRVHEITWPEDVGPPEIM